MNKNKVLLALGSSAVAAMLLVGGTAFAQTPSQYSGTHTGYGRGPGGMSGQGGMHGGMMGGKPTVFGTVSAINGDTLTITSKGFGSTTVASKTYSVDATNASVFKNNATSSLSVVAVGDTVVVQGTLSGTSVTATTIRDGVVPMGGMRPGMGRMGSTTMQGGWHNASSTPPASKGMGGFMGKVSGFFHSIFKFF